MGIKKLIAKAIMPELRSILSSDVKGMMQIFGDVPSKSGVVVNQDSAMRLSAVYACVRILSESIAALPLKVYKRGPDGSKAVAYDHPLYYVLHDIASSEQSAFEFRETIVAQLNLWGNAYALKIFDNKGNVVGLKPFDPSQVQLREDKTRPEEYQKYYVINTDEGQKIYFPYEIFHIKGLSFNRKEGLSPIAYAREAIGLGLASEAFGNLYFSNGTNIGGTFETPNALSDDAYNRLKKDLAEKRQGLDNSHGIMILEEGLKYNKTTIPLEDSQFIETRKFQINEICRIFRVPPHLVADLDKATFSNIEHQSIEFVVHTLTPWLVRIEQAIFMQLFTEEERKAGYFVKFNVDGLLRGDVKSRYEAYAVARQNGWMSANDIRSLENLDPLPDEEEGNAYLINGNMITISAAINAGGGDNSGKEPENKPGSGEKGANK